MSHLFLSPQLVSAPPFPSFWLRCPYVTPVLEYGHAWAGGLAPPSPALAERLVPGEPVVVSAAEGGGGGGVAVAVVVDAAIACVDPARGVHAVTTISSASNACSSEGSGHGPPPVRF
jgi:hypothetical protein